MSRFLDDLAAIVFHLMTVASKMVVMFHEDYGTTGIVVVSVVGILAIYFIIIWFLDWYQG